MSDNDMKDEFSWSDNEAVVMRGYGGIAVYTNPHGDVVIRQEGDGMGFDRDPFIVIPRDRVSAVIAAIKKESEATD